MATGTLTGQTIANTYKALLKITGTTAGGETLHATTLKVIEDGDGNPTPIQLAQNRIEIVPTANHANAFEVSQADGTQIFNINSTTPGFTINAATVTLTQDTDFVTSGGVNGMSIDGTTFSVDGTNNRIGIGTASPESQVEIQASSSASYAEGTAGLDNGATLFIQNTDNTAAAYSQIILGTRVSSVPLTRIVSMNVGANDADLAFVLNSSEAMRIDGSTGNVGIGTASPSTSLMVQNGTSIPEISLYHDSDANQGKGRIVFYTDINSSALGESGVKETQCYIELRQEGGTSRKGEIAFAVSDNGAPVEGAWFDNNCNLQFANGKGVQFSAKTPDGTSMSSEILDDYEEGTWTAVGNSSSGSVTINTSFNTGMYTKIGNIVHVQGLFTVSAVSSNSGAFYISGLPFTCNNNAGGETSGYAAVNFRITAQGSAITGSWMGYVATNTTTLYLEEHNLTTGAQSADHMAASTDIMLSATYMV